MEKELTVLENYFSKIGDLKVTLVVFRNELEKPREFSIQKGDWKKLAEVLGELPNDGNSARGRRPDEICLRRVPPLHRRGIQFRSIRAPSRQIPNLHLEFLPVAEHAYWRYLSQANLQALT